MLRVEVVKKKDCFLFDKIPAYVDAILMAKEPLNESKLYLRILTSPLTFCVKIAVVGLR